MTSWPQLTEGGSVWLPGPCLGGSSKKPSVLEPLVGSPLRGARAWPALGGPGRKARCPKGGPRGTQITRDFPAPASSPQLLS